MKPLVATLLVCTTFLSAAQAQPKASTAPQTVTVFAAASLTAAFQAMGTAFESDHAGTKVQFNFGGSSTLVQQIQQGAPVDVFASADEANMQKLVDSAALAGTAQPFARNLLQIAVASGNPKHIAGLADLTKPGPTIALCGPTVPCGRYAAEAFRKAGLTPPAASQELDVKAVLSKVALGEADAGIVYVTDVRAAAGKVDGIDIPESSNVVARYPIAIVKGSQNQEAAAAFVEFVLSPRGQQLLAGFGFLPR
ncbi:MAG TPA: molybdate ABC transporter substrate-binding protein [Candidatus Acidoferrales bacterium]|nr:molybdate ABC transporter substrate-binding protein [Candidatus Acidoferrales bacterium]